MSKVLELIMSFKDEDGRDFVQSEEFINKEITSEFGYDAQFVYYHIGGFDSPGYDVDCYAMAFIDENGKLQLEGWECETY